MIRYANYCKPDSMKLLGIPGAFDDEIIGELKPCPLCGRTPKPMVREDSLDGYFAAVSCFGGTGATHAYVSQKGHAKYPVILERAIKEWNEGTISIYDDSGKHPWSRGEDGKTAD